MKKKDWMPEIVYSEDSPVPMIEVPVDQDMPEKLFFWIYKQTGEFEPGPEGEEVPVCDMDIHMYFNYNKLKEVLPLETLDQIRVSFGLEPLNKASEKGQKITNKVLDKTQ